MCLLDIAVKLLTVANMEFFFICFFFQIIYLGLKYMKTWTVLAAFFMMMALGT